MRQANGTHAESGQQRRAAVSRSLLRAFTDGDDIDAIDSMIRQQERISGLVDDLLFLVRLDVDPFVADYEEINLNSLAASLLSDVKDLPKSRGISFVG